MSPSGKRQRPSRKKTHDVETTVFTINDRNNGDWSKIDFAKTGAIPDDAGVDDTGQAGTDGRQPSRPGRSKGMAKGGTKGTANLRKRSHVGSEPGDKEAVGLRIIGGNLRGSKLSYAGDNRVRPMKDRVREAVFNLIGPTVKGKHTVDLFAGTGALAIEAISRGAVGATLIEMHFPTARNARKNIEALHLEDRTRLIVSDTFYWSHLREGLPADVPWVVFCSPPYDFYVDRLEEMLALLDRLRLAAPPESLFVVEADERFDFSGLPVPIDDRKRRSYPPAEIGIFFVD